MGLNDCHDGNARALLAPHCQPSRPEQNSDKAIPKRPGSANEPSARGKTPPQRIERRLGRGNGQSASASSLAK